MPAPAHPPVDLVLGQSVNGWRLALLLHILAGVVPLFSAGGAYMVGLWPLLAFSLCRSYRRFVSAPTLPVATIRFHNQQWLLSLCSGETREQWLPCELYGERLVTPFLTILTFRDNGCARQSVFRQCFPAVIAVVIFGDAVEKEPYRQLRVLLRHI